MQIPELRTGRGSPLSVLLPVFFPRSRHLEPPTPQLTGRHTPRHKHPYLHSSWREIANTFLSTSCWFLLPRGSSHRPVFGRQVRKTMAGNWFVPSPAGIGNQIAYFCRWGPIKQAPRGLSCRLPFNVVICLSVQARQAECTRLDSIGMIGER